MKYLFICTGNRFRSMLAEALSRKKGLDADSAGTEPADRVFEEVKQLASGNGLEEFVEYDPEKVDQNSVSEADKIICMTSRHSDFLIENFSVETSKIETWEIQDRSPEEDLEPVLKQLEKRVEKLVA